MFENIKTAKTIAIFCHIRPDGDTIGAALALKHGLNSLSKKVLCYCDGIIPEYLMFLKGADTFLNDDKPENCDLFISVDCADSSRLGKYQNAFCSHKNTLNLDHHITNNHYAKKNIILPYAAACEIVYEQLIALNIRLNKDISDCLYTGISTDTGNFTQANTTKLSHVIVAKLMDYGIDVEDLSLRLFKEVKRDKLLLISDCIKNMRLFENDRISLIFISRDDLQKYKLSLTDTEGIINYAINLKGVKIGICVSENEKGKYKVSLRSRKPVDVSKICKDFGGGGHKQASGMMLFGMYEQAVEKLIARCRLELE